MKELLDLVSKTSETAKDLAVMTGALREKLEELARQDQKPDDTGRFSIQAFSQSDPRWADVVIGTHPTYKMRGWGCAICCAAMVVSQVDPEVNPKVLHDSVKANGGFWGANLNWLTIPQIWHQVEFDGIANWSHRLATEEELDLTKSYIDRAPLILWVDANPRTTKHNSHFVVGIEWLGDDVKIIDPLGGVETTLITKYGYDRSDSDLARWIYGIRPLVVNEGSPVSYSALGVEVDAFDIWPEREPTVK